MARTSKYQKDTSIPTSTSSLVKTGIYTRLSVSDGDDISESMKAAKGGDGTANYNCSNYKESGGARCSNHYISQAAILTAITQRIDEILADGFLSEVGTSLIAKYENQIAKIDALILLVLLRCYRRSA